MAEKIRVTIDREGCIQCGVCYSVCSEVFEENPEDGFSSIVETYRTDDEGAEGQVPGDLEDCVTEAAESCPVEVIHVEG
jgi:ferredoxin